MKIFNDSLEIAVSELGAELQSLKLNGKHELLWQGDKESWAGQSPALFPIVGVLKQGKTRIEGQEYEMACHGFARKVKFELIEQSDHQLTYRLQSSEQTKKSYPYDFSLSITYTLKERALIVDYRVLNRGTKPMDFCLGAHPGFALNWKPGDVMSDYNLRFSQPVSAETLLVAENGQIKNDCAPCLIDTEVLPLKDELFDNNALIFKDLLSEFIIIERRDHSRQLKFSWQNFPWMGVWSLPKAAFLCLEPWMGHGDLLDCDGDFSSKPGLVNLAPAADFHASWQVEIAE